MQSGAEVPLATSRRANRFHYFYFASLSLRCIVLLFTGAVISAFSISGSSTTPMQAFTSKPFVQRALQKACHPTSVLSFWFGVDASTPLGRETLRNGSSPCLQDMSGLWYNGGPEFDTICQPFADVVHMAGTKSLPKEDGWYTSVDGVVAQVVLIDQLARNIFRGTQDAFRYETIALDIARQLSTAFLKQNPEFQCATTSGPNPSEDHPPFNNITEELYPPYCSLIATTLMHSETSSDHSLCISLINQSMQLAQKRIDEKDESTKILYNWFQYQLKFENDHKDVIDRFGRYPHRNRLLNRTSTEAELKWLSDVDALPGWAKSQG